MEEFFARRDYETRLYSKGRARNPLWISHRPSHPNRTAPIVDDEVDGILGRNSVDERCQIVNPTLQCVRVVRIIVGLVRKPAAHMIGHNAAKLLSQRSNNISVIETP